MKSKVLSLIALVLLASVCYGIWIVFSATLSFLKSSPPEVAAAIIATSGTILVGIAANIAERIISKNRDIAEAHRPKKIECYSKFLHKTFNFFHNSGQGNEKKQKELMDGLIPSFQEFTTDSMLWSSPEVLHAYQNFKIASAREPQTSMIHFDNLLKAIREDLGHKNKGLKRGDLIKMLAKDPSEFDQVLGIHK